MGRRGPAPLPTNLKLINGTKPHRINKEEPKVPIAVPEAPDHLVPKEIEVFNRMAEKLAKMRVMTDCDVDALSVYSVAYVRWVEATAAVRKKGVMVAAKNGTPMQNPYLSIANKAQKDMVDILREFGMTPSARSRVHAK